MPLDFLYNTNVLQMAVTYSAPLILAAIGELIIERSGVINVAIEGVMLIAASVGFITAFYTESLFIGCIAALLIAGLIGVLHAFMSVYLKGHQIIIGLGLLIFCTGLSALVYRIFIGIRVVAPKIPVLQRVDIPLLSKIPYVGSIFFSQPVLVYLAYVLVPIVAIVLFRTPLGLRLRACGENPRAIDSLGINVYKFRFYAIVTGSSIIGLAGFFLPAVLTGSFSDGMVGGRGWLSLQLVIFGRWIPKYVLVGSLLFAYIESMQYRLAMITKAIPSQFFLMLPYLSAIVIIVFVYKRSEAPLSFMKPYDREKR